MLNNNEKLFLNIIASGFEKSKIDSMGLDNFYQMVKKYKLFSLIYKKQKHGSNVFSPKIIEELRISYLHNLFVYQQNRQETMKLAEYFAQKDIPMIILKGVFLNDLIHQDEAVRNSSCDVDVLVKIGDFSKALKALEEIGYSSHKTNKIENEDQARSMHLSCDGQIVIDLHHGLCYDEFSIGFESSIYWQRNSFFDLGPIKARGFSNEAQFLYCCLLIVKEIHYPNKVLPYFLDFHFFLLRHGANLDYDYLLEIISQNKFNAYVSVVFNELVDCSESDYKLDKVFLRKIRVSRLREKLLHWVIVRWHNRTSSKWYLKFLIFSIANSGGYFKSACDLIWRQLSYKHNYYLNENKLKDNGFSWFKHFFRMIKTFVRHICQRSKVK